MATEKKYDIFISYSRKNLEKVKAIKMEIEKSTGAECWMDLEGIESGSTQFTQDIVDGINNCRVFLFMLSEYSQASEFALRELNFVMKKAKTDKLKHVIIVNIDDCKMSDEFEFIYGLTDTIAWLNQPQREKLLRDLKRWFDLDTHTSISTTSTLSSSIKKEDPANPVYQHRQGLRYLNGDGVPQDYLEAVRWFKKAAEQGFLLSQILLGNIYFNGDGMPQDYSEAVKWYRKATEQSYYAYELGYCYEMGLGVSWPDRIEAEKCYTLAASKGDEDAKKALERLHIS
jgi:hypothetical protein